MLKAVMKNRTFVYICCILAAGFSHSVGAQGQCAEPVNINADSSDTSISDGRTILRGNVNISQCELDIHADEALILTRDRQIQRVELTGTPVRVDQNSGSLGKVNATADTVDYDVVGAVMVFTGNARIIHAQGEVNGEQIRYEILNDRFQGGGDENDGRIQIRLDAPEQLLDSSTPDAEDS